MDINNSKTNSLSTGTLALLYKKGLYKLIEVQQTDQLKKTQDQVDIQEDNTVKTFTHYGLHRKKVLVFVDIKEFFDMSLPEYQLLLKILLSCQLTIDDVALISLLDNPKHTKVSTILEYFASNTILIFGSLLKSTLKPDLENIVNYHLHTINKVKVMQFPSLKGLLHTNEHVIAEKKLIWTALKSIFQN
ncbi:MAG: hypothetical protein QM528_01130 [Phycisphaerales bacterium]|nr:hypothetical protein [Phycisphaerales bacterium]